MLSVLIPIYNYNVVQLVTTLHKQLIACNIPFEIICLDDASPLPENSEQDFKELAFITYNVLKINIGRSKIRNRLVEIAKYDNLIFLDCDTLPVHDNFCSNYINALKKHTIVFGGLNYKTNFEDKKSLRYKYGLKRESISINKRLGSNKNHFTTANFAVKKKIFKSIQFDENHINYGHEDTLFSIDILKNGYNINQINNPVYHLQLDNNQDYISKTESSSRNLLRYYNLNRIKPEDVKILKYYTILHNYKLGFLMSFLFKLMKSILIKNLISKTPKLWVFDFYRFGFLFTLTPKND